MANEDGEGSRREHPQDSFLLPHSVSLLGSGAKKEKKEANSNKPSVREERPVGSPVTETVRTTLPPPKRKQIINPSPLADFLFLRIPKPSVVSVISPPNVARVRVSLWPQPG